MTTFAQPAGATTVADAAMTADRIADLRTAFDSDPRWRVARNAITQTTVDDVALDRSIVTSIDASFSTLLDDWTVTNQKKSGRCWMFAALNLLRVGAMETMHLKAFEFSQNHVLFWDKFERANYFLESIIATADRPIDDRTVAFLLDRPLDDGGQWNMFVAIVRKHGLVPKAVMPETESSSNTRRMNGVLVHAVRQGARTLRERTEAGATPAELRDAKQAILEIVWRILCIHLGAPPDTFDWQWNDTDRAFHRDGAITPKAFAERYVTLPLDDYVCLVHDPRPTSPVNRTFTVEYLGNVVDADPVLYLNVELDLMKDIARHTIEGGEPVWFGCDVAPMMRRDLGIWDANLYDYEGLYGAAFDFDKAGRLAYHQSLMTHAMLFTGVDVVDGTPRRWRVENSWGEEKHGHKGFCTMNDSWFDEYLFEIAARRSALPDAVAAALDEPPIVLPPWDPMGSLAR